MMLASIGVCVITAASLPLLPSAESASADPLADARAEANQLTAQIQAEQNQLEVLSQQYDAAEQHVQQLASEITQIQGQIAVTKQKVALAQASLRHDALIVYMDGGSAASLDGVFSGASTRSSLEQMYRSVAADNVSNAIDNLRQVQATLDSQQVQLQQAQSQAQAAVTQAAAAQQSAQSTEQQEQQTLSQVTGQIATLVAQQQAAEERAQQIAYQQRLAQQQAAAAAAAQAAASEAGADAASAVSDAAAPVEDDVPVASGAAGAVQAAESQLGVPYVWGGETPGVGFDCSGLTQWAWGQAGVSIPRTAQEQYDAIVHISLADLEPGDLLFWNDGTSSVQHVAMYVGNGEVIQAPETGETVSYAPIWNDGLVGAGRP